MMAPVCVWRRRHGLLQPSYLVQTLRHRWRRPGWPGLWSLAGSRTSCVCVCVQYCIAGNLCQFDSRVTKLETANIFEHVLYMFCQGHDNLTIFAAAKLKDRQCIQHICVSFNISCAPIKSWNIIRTCVCVSHSKKIAKICIIIKNTLAINPWLISSCTTYGDPFPICITDHNAQDVICRNKLWRAREQICSRTGKLTMPMVGLPDSKQPFNAFYHSHTCCNEWRQFVNVCVRVCFICSLYRPIAT